MSAPWDRTPMEAYIQQQMCFVITLWTTDTDVQILQVIHQD